MADRILGPACPALLGIGAVVYDEAEDAYGVVVCWMAGHGPDDEPDIDEDDPGPQALIAWNVCGADAQAPEWCSPDDLAIDYADPHTRDRVRQALAAALKYTTPWADALPDIDNLCAWGRGPAHDRAEAAAIAHRDAPVAVRYRAVAAAVWGPR